MKYQQKLIVRVLIALIIRPSIFYVIFSYLTIYVPFLLLRLFGFNAIIEPSVSSIYINQYSFFFVPACIASSAYYLMSLLVLTTRDISLNKSIKMLLIGFLGIFTLNIIRIVFLILVFIYFGLDIFNKVHLVFWYGVSTLFVVIIWLFLTKLYKIKTIPVYSDIKYLYKLSKTKKK